MRGALARATCAVFLSWTLAGCLVVPMFQAPDEQTHVLRAVQVAHGGLVGVRQGALSGGVIPSNLLRVLGGFADLPGHPERKASLAELRGLDGVPWGGAPFMISFPNTVTYGPACYLPQALGVAMGRAAGLSILRSLYLARICAALAFVALATAAVAVCRRGEVFLAFVLALPMTLFLAGSVSQDGIVLGLCGLLAAVLTRHDGVGRWSWRRWALLGAGFAVLGMAKPPCALLSPVVLLVASRGDRRASLLCPAVAVVATGLWLLLAVAPLKVALRPDGDLSDIRQMHYLLQHPGLVPRLVMTTLRINWWLYYSELIGRLGWLDTLLPEKFYKASGVLLAIVWADGAALAGAPAPVRRAFVLRSLALGGLAGIYALAVFLSLYITWSSVGAPTVEGVQGRYFLPLLPFLACVLPREARVTPPSRATGMAFVAWTALAAFVTFAALWQRFW